MTKRYFRHRRARGVSYRRSLGEAGNQFDNNESEAEEISHTPDLPDDDDEYEKLNWEEWTCLVHCVSTDFYKVFQTSGNTHAAAIHNLLKLMEVYCPFVVEITFQISEEDHAKARKNWSFMERIEGFRWFEAKPDKVASIIKKWREAAEATEAVKED